MARPKTRYVCQQCGHNSPKWMGRCPDCGEWNSHVEQVETPRSKGGRLSSHLLSQPVPLDEVPQDGEGEVRVRTGIGVLDEVLGGGLVSGSLVLIGGDPGVGKSTLLLQVMDAFASRGLPVLYVSGEESVRQVRLRAQRLGIASHSLLLLAETDLERIEAVVRDQKPVVVVLDSVQTVHLPHLQSVPGSISQVREVAHRSMLLAKNEGPAVILVGHVTKSGDLAGPKVLEHLVDAVVYFEGDGRSPLRILRTHKNRFGASGEVGLFEMSDRGLLEVPDASARLLGERHAGAPGTAVLAAMEGSRPLLAEVQALVGPSQPATPGRTCVGLDRNRVILLAAVLGKHGVRLHDRDLFVNAAGGVRLDEPAADLAVVAALASSATDTPLPDDCVVFGEVGLVGEVRSVSRPEARMKEALRHGFRKVIAPRAASERAPEGLEVLGVGNLAEALALLLQAP